MSKIAKHVSDFIAQRIPAPANQSGAERRSEPRWEPEGLKTVTVLGDVVAVVRDESQGGACLKMPAATDVSMGQQLTVLFGDEATDFAKPKQEKIGRVCWTTVDNFGSHRLVGLAWV